MTDYYPFGMTVPNRSYSSPFYRYGFNGMEKDDNIKGNNNSYTTSFRSYDPRIGRWLSLDPLMAKYPYQSPYAAFNLNPIYYKDPTGLEGDPPNDPPKTKTHKVQAGETYYCIAKAYDVSVNDLRSWNEWEDEDIPTGSMMTVSYTPGTSSYSYENAPQNFSATLYSSDVSLNSLASATAGGYTFDVPTNVASWEMGETVIAKFVNAGVEVGLPTIGLDVQIGSIDFKDLIGSSIKKTLENTRSLSRDYTAGFYVDTEVTSDYYSAHLSGLSFSVGFPSPGSISEYDSKVGVLKISTVRKIDSVAKYHQILKVDPNNNEALEFGRRHSIEELTREN